MDRPNIPPVPDARPLRSDLKRGTVVQVEIGALSHDGDGMGRTKEGDEVHVAGTVPGEFVEAKISHVAQRRSYADLRRVVEGGADRVAPPCRHFGACGGCTVQHVSETMQLEQKRWALERELRDAGVPIRPFAVLPTGPYGVRTKVQMVMQPGFDGARAGFFARHSHDLIEIAECPIQHDVATDTALCMADLVRELKMPVYDEATGEGQVRFVCARVSRFSAQALATLVVRDERAPRLDEFATKLMARIPAIVGVHVNVNAKPGNVIWGPETFCVRGAEEIEERVGPNAYVIGPTSFFQTNPEAANVIREVVRGYASFTDRRAHALDLYCGVGLLSLGIADLVAEVTGVEGHRSAVRDAVRSAEKNGITNARFVCDLAERAIGKAARGNERIDLVMVDPPREGCPETLLVEVAKKLRPKALIYESCSPRTLARDLAILGRMRYRTREVQPVDMFPQTMHLEAVAYVEAV